MPGFTKAYRKELKSDIWKMPPLDHRVFYYLRQEVRWKSAVFPTRKKFGIHLNPGQTLTSYDLIADGVAWTDYGKLKKPNKKTVKDILEWLETNGMVSVFSNAKGTFVIITNWDTYNSVGREEVTESIPQEKRTTDNALEHALDTIKELNKKLQEGKRSKDSKGPARPRCPYQKILDIYHEELPLMAIVRELSDDLKTSIRARWNSSEEKQNLEWWKWYFGEQVKNSAFLTGNNKENWMADFGWLVLPRNMTKVLNGKYNSKSTNKPTQEDIFAGAI